MVPHRPVAAARRAPLLATFFALFNLLALAVAADLSTTVILGIPPSAALPNPNILPPTTHMTLTSSSSLSLKKKTAPISTSNTFVFHNVTSGSYLADVHCATHGFAPLRVDVLPSVPGSGNIDDVVLQVKAWETYRGNDWDNKGEEAATIAVPGKVAARALEVKPLVQKVYFTERGSFSVLSILKNPMILMSLVSLGAFIGLPKLMENSK